MRCAAEMGGPSGWIGCRYSRGPDIVGNVDTAEQWRFSAWLSPSRMVEFGPSPSRCSMLLAVCNETVSCELVPKMVRWIGIAFAAAAMQAPVNRLAGMVEIGR